MNQTAANRYNTIWIAMNSISKEFVPCDDDVIIVHDLAGHLKIYYNTCKGKSR